MNLPQDTSLAAENLYTRHIKRLFWIVAINMPLVASLFGFLAWRTGINQLYIFTWVSVASLIFAGLGYLFARAGKPLWGAWLDILAIIVTSMAATLVFSGLGLLLGIGLAFVIISISSQILPPRHSERAIYLSMLAGVLSVVIDEFIPLNRLETPTYVFIILIVILSIFGAALGYNILQQFSQYRLRTKLIMGFFAIAILGTVGVGFAINIVVQSELLREVGASLQTQARQNALAIGNDLVKQVELLQTLALNEKIEQNLEAADEAYTGDQATIRANIDRLDQQWRAADAANNNADPLVAKILGDDTATELTSFREANSAHLEIFVTDKYGALLATTNRTSDYNQADEDWWQKAYNDGEGAVYFGAPVFDESSQTYACEIALPVTVNETGELIGILRSTYQVSALAQSLANLHFGTTGEALLVFPNGELLDANGTRFILDADTFAQIQAITQGYKQVDFQGGQRLVSQSPIFSIAPNKDVVASLNWRLAVSQDPKEALNPAQTVRRTAIAISLAVLFLASILAFVGAQYLSTPISHLTDTAELIRTGNLSARAAVESQDEIGTLATTFNAMTEQLQETLQGLEQRIAERTLDLEHRSMELSDRTVQLELANIRTQKRAAQLQAISEVSRSTASIRNLADLLPRVTKVISEQFGFYHVGIFLTDATNQYAILSAANSEGGQRMLARSHRLKVGAQGIVGYVTATGAPRIALDTGIDAAFFDNPDLPNTRSEMAIPLKSEGQVMGALDVQSEQANAFTQEDTSVLQTLADQVSIAINNARLFEQAQRSLTEAETVYRQYLRKEWEHTTSAKQILGFRYSAIGSTPLKERLQDEHLKKALATGEIMAAGAADEQASLSIPIKVRNEVIGVLNIRTPGKRAWKSEEIGLVQAVADRVAVSAENARLFDETTSRAERERTVSEITSKIRSTNDPNEMIRIALSELKQALQVKEARIVPYTPPTGNESN